MVQADAYVAAGEVEQACTVALKAITTGEQIRSARCIGYLREFRQHMIAVGATVAVNDFLDQATDSRLWRIAARAQNQDGRSPAVVTEVILGKPGVSRMNALNGRIALC
jgi:hypothetical protein